jgi:hypothetical protein
LARPKSPVNHMAQVRSLTSIFPCLIRVSDNYQDFIYLIAPGCPSVRQLELYISMSYWYQTFSQACMCHGWRKHQIWDFSEMVWYFLRFNWISAWRHQVIQGWTESTPEIIRNSAKLFHRVSCGLENQFLWR